jgi:broad specificity phosphatase PhoE
VSDALPAIYFVRHGETDWNRQGIIQGWTDIPLNPSGHTQAKAVALALRVHFSEVMTRHCLVSPMLRTRETMGHIATALGVTDDDVVIDPMLKELGFGIWEGKPFWELKASPVYPADPETRYDWRPEGGESYRDGESRLKALLARISQPTIIVSHGALGRCLIGMLTGMTLREIMAIRMVQGAYCRIEAGQAQWFDATTAPA